MKRKINSVVALLTTNQGIGAMVARQALEAIIKDVSERPALDKARKLVLEFSFTPVMDKKPQPMGLPTLETVDWSLQIVSKIPGQRTRDYSAKVKDGVLLFNEESPDNVHQGTLDEVNGVGAEGEDD